jgi:hypothetical protein
MKWLFFVHSGYGPGYSFGLWFNGSINLLRKKILLSKKILFFFLPTFLRGVAFLGGGGGEAQRKSTF